MLFVSNILEIIKLGIASSYVKNDEPVSIMLLGDPEIGKSSVLLCFKELNGTKIFTDLTKTKLEKFYLEDIKNRKVKYLVIPDFIKVVSRGRAAKANIVSLLNAGIEEGIRDITEYLGGIPKTETIKPPLKFGLATAMTRDTISDRRREWHKIGFFSRLLPVSFSYTKEQAKRIRDHIFSGRDINATKINLKLKKKSVKCLKKYPKMFEEQIEQYAEAQHLYGFRLSKQIRGLLKASALLRGKDIVTMVDVRKIKKLSKYMNLEYSKVN